MKNKVLQAAAQKAGSLAGMLNRDDLEIVLGLGGDTSLNAILSSARVKAESDAGIAGAEQGRALCVFNEAANALDSANEILNKANEAVAVVDRLSG